MIYNRTRCPTPFFRNDTRQRKCERKTLIQFNAGLDFISSKFHKHAFLMIFNSIFVFFSNRSIEIDFQGEKILMLCVEWKNFSYFHSTGMKSVSGNRQVRTFQLVFRLCNQKNVVKQKVSLKSSKLKKARLINPFNSIVSFSKITLKVYSLYFQNWHFHIFNGFSNFLIISIYAVNYSSSATLQNLFIF